MPLLNTLGVPSWTTPHQPPGRLPSPLLALHPALIAVIAVVALVIAVVIVVVVLKSMKGKLTIELERAGFNCGELVTGRLHVELKKSLETRRLFVALVGYEEYETRDSDGDRRKERHEVFRMEENLVVDLTLPAGHSQTYEFQVAAPEPGGYERGQGRGWLDGIDISIGDVNLGFGSGRSRLLWYVEARLDTPGLDLTANRKVQINTG